MNKFIFFIIFSFFIFNNSYSFTKGQGELKMSESSINHFIDYIHGKFNVKKKPEWTHKPKPDRLVLSSNGNWSYGVFCPWSACSFRDLTVKIIQDCERITGVSCGVFASKRTIYWDNGINTKKNKAKFKSKMTALEIRAKLKEYGFIGEATEQIESKKKKKVENKKDKKAKITKKITQTDDVVSQIKELKELLDSGVITQEEFEKAKKKILN